MAEYKLKLKGKRVEDILLKAEIDAEHIVKYPSINKALDILDAKQDSVDGLSTSAWKALTGPTGTIAVLQAKDIEHDESIAKAYSGVTCTVNNNGSSTIDFYNKDDALKATVTVPVDIIGGTESFTTKVAVGKIPAGTIINPTDSLQSILKRIFCGDGADIPVTGVTLNKASTSIKIGSTETLTATVLPENATNKNVTWKSSDDNIAMVSNTGVVTAKSIGNAIIKVTTEDGGFTATCSTTVEKVAVDSVNLDESSISIKIGSTKQLKATVKPDNATNKNVTWSTNNSSVATVSSTGIVTAKGIGNATITVASVDNPSKIATCTTIVEKIAVESVSLNKSSLNINVGSAETLTATVKPDNATDKRVTWASDNTLVATVDANGKVTAISAGEAKITATSVDDSSKIATCTTKVSAIPVTGVSLDKSSLNIVVGKTAKLNATIVPNNATNKNVTWTSSDISVATISANKLEATISAIKEGNTMITVTTEDGSKTATCNVNVIASTSKVGYYAGPSIATTIGGDNWTFKDEQISATSLIYEYYTTVKSYYAVAYPKTRGELKHIYQNDFTEVDLISDFVKESATYNDVEYWLYKWETRQSATAPEKDKFEYIF